MTTHLSCKKTPWTKLTLQQKHLTGSQVSELGHRNRIAMQISRRIGAQKRYIFFAAFRRHPRPRPRPRQGPAHPFLRRLCAGIFLMKIGWCESSFRPKSFFFAKRCRLSRFPLAASFSPFFSPPEEKTTFISIFWFPQWTSKTKSWSENFKQVEHRRFVEVWLECLRVSLWGTVPGSTTGWPTSSSPSRPSWAAAAVAAGRRRFIARPVIAFHFPCRAQEFHPDSESYRNGFFKDIAHRP